MRLELLADPVGRLDILLLDLVALDERLHERRRDQSHRVASRLELPGPVVRTGAGLRGYRHRAADTQSLPNPRQLY